MTLYIEPKNQTLLWTTIQKHPFTAQIFPPGSSAQEKSAWFKNIISQIYDTIPSSIITQQQLLDLNKETLRRMIEDMRQYITAENSKVNSQIKSLDKNLVDIPPMKQTIEQKNIYPLETDRSFSRESILENKTSAFERDLIQKQKEYDLFNTKPTPPTVKFEEVNDGVIKNMDELIEQQRRERERDLQVITSVYNNINNINNNNNRKPSINISGMNEENTNIQIDILEIPEENQKYQISEALESKIEELTKKYTKLLNFLEEKIPDFQNQFSQYDISNNG